MIYTDANSPWIVFCDKNGDVKPKYATKYSTGFDLVATEDVYVKMGVPTLIPTGLYIKKAGCIQIPNGYLLLPDVQIRPKSGKSLKTSVRVANSPGTIDIDYPSDQEIKIIVESHEYDVQIKAGDAYAQVVIGLAIRLRDDDGEERVGGFGSTGG